MPDLVETLKTIQRRIREHEAILRENEALTRYALIDPLLRALDWDLEEPEIMIPEDYDEGKTRRVDYNLGNDTLMLEAKKLGLPLDKFQNQLHEHMKKHKSDYGMLTDGDVWRIYKIAGTSLVHNGEFKVTNPLNLTIPRIMHFHRLTIMPSKQPEPRPDDTPDSGSAISILKHKYVSVSKSPTKLIVPDGSSKNISAWRNILLEVVQWLVDSKKITLNNCPFPPDMENYILNTEAVHGNGRKFQSFKEVDTIFVDLNINPQTSLSNSIKLIRHANMDPSEFKISFDA